MRVSVVCFIRVGAKLGVGHAPEHALPTPNAPVGRLLHRGRGKLGVGHAPEHALPTPNAPLGRPAPRGVGANSETDHNPRLLSDGLLHRGSDREKSKRFP